MELRRSKRYPLAARARFRWLRPDGTTGSGHGYTRDISSAGAFVITTKFAPLESKIEIELALPAVGHGISTGLLEATGNVVRTENDGFAATADFNLQLHASDSCDDREPQRCLAGHGQPS